MAKRSGGLATLSVGDLRREIARRERRVGGLIRKRERFLEKARHIEEQIAELGGSVRGPGGGISGRRRPQNASNLVEALSKVLTDKVMSVTDVTDAVQKAGYQTTSPNFRTIVNQALIASGKFKRVGRGQYTAK